VNQELSGTSITLEIKHPQGVVARARLPLWAEVDAGVVHLWLRGQRSKRTQETYTATIRHGKRAGEQVTRSLVSPHWLRHAHASHALARGADLALVRDTLGHASIETTGRYAHARPNSSSALFLAL
jgi:site-specific recombinase XerD